MDNKEFLEKVEQLFSPEQWYNEDYEDDEETAKIIEELGEPNEVDHYGGEGRGDSYHVVVHFPKVDKYVRAEAYYSSGNGVSDWENWFVVTKQERVITVYE